MSTMRKLLAGTAVMSLAFGAAAALAADPMPLPVVVAPIVMPPAAPATLAGYVDLHVGYGRGYEWLIEEEEEEGQIEEWFWRELIVGGAGRAAYQFRPNFAVQLDSWFNIFAQTVEFYDDGVLDDEFFDTEGAGGIATHAVLGGAGAFQFGALASIGGIPDYGMFANVAGEVAATFNRFRVETQAGYTFGIQAGPAVDGERDIYVRASGTFYLNPGFAVSANVGWDRFFETATMDPDIQTQLTYGARAELQLGASPFTAFVAYQGWRWNGFDGDEAWGGTEHAIVAGVRLLFGHDTLQELDHAVGFADLNAMYGDPFAAH